MVPLTPDMAGNVRVEKQSSVSFRASPASSPQLGVQSIPSSVCSVVSTAAVSNPWLIAGCFSEHPVLSPLQPPLRAHP